MGSSLVAWVPVLVASHILSLVGLGFGAICLQQHQLTLRELQLQLEVTGGPGYYGESQRGRGQLSGAGPGDPEAAGGRGFAWSCAPSTSPHWAEDREAKSRSRVDSLFWGVVVLVLVLTLLLLAVAAAGKIRWVRRPGRKPE